MFRRCLPLLLAGLLGGCSADKVVPAVGPAYEIVVLAPQGMKVLGEAVADVLGDEVVTVRHEPRYVIAQDVAEEYRFYRTRKILFAVGPRKHETIRKLDDKSTGVRLETDIDGFEIEREPFADGQILFWLTGAPEKILRTLRDHRREILELVEDSTVQLIAKNLYRIAEKEGARRHMRERWGWGVRLPTEWVVEDRSSEDNRFVRIWRDAPVAQIFVSWEDGRVERTVDEWIERRHELGWYHYDRDEVVFQHTAGTEGPTPFGRAGARLRGLWENDVYTIGGPFESWAFYCESDERTYFVDLSVYAPDRDKLPILRTARAVASTFRNGCVQDVRGLTGVLPE